MHLPLDFLERHALAAFEGVLTVAPGAAQIASRQPYKNTWQSGVGGLSLQRLVNLDDLHPESAARTAAKAASNGTPFRVCPELVQGRAAKSIVLVIPNGLQPARDLLLVALQPRCSL